MSVYLSVSSCVNMSVCVSVASRQVGIEGEGVGSQTAGLSATGGRAGGPGQRESGRYDTTRWMIQENKHKQTQRKTKTL